MSTVQCRQTHGARVCPLSESMSGILHIFGTSFVPRVMWAKLSYLETSLLLWGSGSQLHSGLIGLRPRNSKP